jgi:hypothetical protein
LLLLSTQATLQIVDGLSEAIDFRLQLLDFSVIGSFWKELSVAFLKLVDQFVLVAYLDLQVLHNFHHSCHLLFPIIQESFVLRDLGL